MRTDAFVVHGSPGQVCYVVDPVGTVVETARREHPQNP
jgi:hypothetical protein